MSFQKRLVVVVVLGLALVALSGCFPSYDHLFDDLGEPTDQVDATDNESEQPVADGVNPPPDLDALDGQDGPTPECTDALECGGSDSPCVEPRCEDGQCVLRQRDGPCDDGDPCTIGDSCAEGLCQGGPTMSCPPTSPCEQGGACDGVTGACVFQLLEDGTLCADGVCVGGRCGLVPDGMVLVPGGAAVIGDSDFGPVRVVEISSFFIDTLEVTVAEYMSCVTAQACTVPRTDVPSRNYGVAGREDHPVNWVDWFQAEQYCSWRGRRLCSEAEWEKAARGGCSLYTDCIVDTPTYPWGNDIPDCDYAVVKWPTHLDSGCGTGATFSIGSKPAGASPYGVLDMIGNVAEWVADCWHANYGGAPTDGAAWTWDCESTARVHRGGAWTSTTFEVSAPTRNVAVPVSSGFGLGIRCCREANP